MYLRSEPYSFGYESPSARYGHVLQIGGFIARKVDTVFVVISFDAYTICHLLLRTDAVLLMQINPDDLYYALRNN